MAYVSWTKGYKSGTYKTVNVYTQPQYVRPETVETSEIGFKSTFMHGALRFNAAAFQNKIHDRSEEHTSELQSLMRISYAVFCLKKNINSTYCTNSNHIHYNYTTNLNHGISLP